MDGGEPPASLIKDLQLLPTLPAAARESLPEILNEAVLNADDYDAKLSSFAKQHGIADRVLLATTMRALGFVLQAALTRDLSIEVLLTDLSTCGVTPSDAAAVSSQYDTLRIAYRKRAERLTTQQQGHHFLNAHWRAYNIYASNVSHNIKLPLVDITFEYISYGERSSQTITFSPESIHNLQQLLTQIQTLFSEDVITYNPKK